MSVRTPTTKEVFEVFGVVGGTQVLSQLVAGLLKFSEFQASLLGLGVLVVSAIVYFGFGYRRIRATGRGQRPVFVVIAGVVCTALVLFGADAVKVEAEHTVLHADFAVWLPDSSQDGTRFVRVPTGSDRATFDMVPVYQEATYLWSTRLDWHLFGTFENTSESPGGQLDVQVLAPTRAVSHRTHLAESEVGAGKELVWTYSFPLAGVDSWLILTHHYNCFFHDDVHYGWTLRAADVKELDVTFDFHRLDPRTVLDPSETPTIVVESEAFLESQTKRVPADGSFWDTGILKAHFSNLKKGTQVYLRAKWKRPEFNGGA